MQVDITEENILLYDLVQLTGNSKEKLLASAEEAMSHGYVLTCRIPDPDEPLQLNVFDEFETSLAEDVWETGAAKAQQADWERDFLADDRRRDENE